jgi:deoxyribodipyrimidine photolyase-related protein
MDVHSFDDFYIEQRKKFRILIEENGDPVGGKWCFNAERKKLSKDVPLPTVYTPDENEFVREAQEYVRDNFNSNCGECNDFHYATTHNEALLVLEDFLFNRMRLFGDYYTAVVSAQSVLFHSSISPALNIGLLTPKQVIEKTFEYAAIYFYPLNALEGFVRRIIGCREFVRRKYANENVSERTCGVQNFKRKIPASFWIGETGIVPIDTTVKKVLKTGYCHHFERLMVLGNFMQLCEFDPDEIYHWFMELFIDAYDWTTMPNVYGASQVANGGVLNTTPAISGSNFILKTSDYKKGKWCEVWDALYWRYIDKHKDVFKQNHGMALAIALLSKMEKSKLDRHIKIADKFLFDFEYPASVEIDDTVQL